MATINPTTSNLAEFAGKRALVTGGSRGIGAAIVRQLLDAGASVLTTARSADAKAPDGAAFVQADVRTGTEALAADAQRILGGVDLLVHNAGGARPHSGALAIPDDEWRDALDLNLLAAVRLDALLAPAMRDRGSGAIVHISSAALRPPVPPFLHYVAAKTALEAYSKGLAAELAPAGIRVNAVSPGRTTTPGGVATRDQWTALAPAVGGDVPNVPLGRDGEPDDIANAVLFLLSDQASWLTGSTLVVDGGEFTR
ncbi:oxidoreductase [Amycolatopsis benzoatilytica]|uniref:oxidoreductase n=1 Tax=Amycolatopsis benzoatilytica TaxID=346045 RepID=UPI00035F1D50|nr:oxidoreductase [Amycolatopsis benzoatilytica]